MGKPPFPRDAGSVDEDDHRYISGALAVDSCHQWLLFTRVSNMFTGRAAVITTMTQIADQQAQHCEPQGHYPAEEETVWTDISGVSCLNKRARAIVEPGNVIAHKAAIQINGL